MDRVEYRAEDVTMRAGETCFAIEDAVGGCGDAVSADGAGECLQLVGGFLCGVGAWVVA